MKNNLFFRFLASIGSFFAFFLGRLNWTSPPWATYIHRQATNRPKIFWPTTVAIVTFFISITYSYIWYINSPKPLLASASITAPKISTIVDDALVIDQLTIDFVMSDATGNVHPQSVAPLQQIGQDVEHGITLSPIIEGKWRWQSDSQLVFTPAKDWPAGQTFAINFSKTVFTADTKMQRLNYSFSTQPFEANISELKFYQDPLDAKLRQIVATITFNYPVDPRSLERNTTLLFESLQEKKNAKSLAYTLTYDKFKRIAYLHSHPITLSDVARYLVLKIDEGVRSITHSDQTHTFISKNVFIPSIADYFKVISANAMIVRNAQDRPEQILAVETSLGVTDANMKKSLHVYLLPQNYPATATEDEKKNYQWQNPGEVSASVLALSSPLTMQAIPADRNYTNLHSYKFNTQTPRYIYLKIDKGVRGFGDFILANDYVAVIKVPEYPKEISFLHKGALLALSGEKKLSAVVRGLPAVKFEFARVLPNNINQLVTQTQGDFNNPYFVNQQFNQQNISEIFSEIQQFDASNLTKQQYTALDFTKYLAASSNLGGPQGLFLMQATGWDIENNSPLDVTTKRLVLITDLGLLVKDNQDGSHDVFIQSITQGKPVANVNVAVLGKNGLPLLKVTTNEQGQANFPSLKDYMNEREPVVYLASFDNDVSFIPYNNPNRQLNYSRYDTGGLYSYNQDQHSLSAYLFSDRGIYRPGDDVHIGMIVKQAFAQPQPPGLVVEATVTDPRGTTILNQKYTLDEIGYLNLNFPTQSTAPTGQYFINLYIVKDQHADSLLGSTTIRVAEFQPDRMRIKAHFSEEAGTGWISPANLKANVQLLNLYGAPAVDRRISGKIVLEPKRVEFSSYPDYIFADPLIDPKKPAKIFTDTLVDIKTNEQGQAIFNLNLERFDKATYQLTFLAEGFEAESGRSVSTQETALVSPRPYFVGYKPDSDLSYMKQNSKHSVNLIAINPQLEQLAISDLTIQFVALQPISTLVKNPNGTYQYQSILQNKILSTKPFNIEKQGTVIPLPNDQIGDFAVYIFDKTNTELNHFKYSIVGASQQPLAKNAELTVKLNRSTYKAGDDIELQITAPYTGAGLITIERDKVYATQWFKSDTTSSVQKIHIPNDFQGNGYVNVAFVRDWNSPDIFISPLSYSVTPFDVDDESHNIKIELNTPELAKPGEPLLIDYHSNKPGKIIVFAIDEGILQVANYHTPAPLEFFFQKRALEVLTQQTVDQILPQYIRERELSAVGGDSGEEGFARYLNPFKRKTDLPVAFWSGIIDTDTTPRQLTYDVPDYFNGSLHVMAVAVAADSVGAIDKTSKIRGDFVINPNTPTFVSPNDEFEITASIANNLKDSGANAKVTVQLHASQELEVIGASNDSIVIAEGQEQTVHFWLRATSKLGDAKITLEASLGNKSSTMDATLSVRPASFLLTTVNSGSSTKEHQSIMIDRTLYPEYRNVEAVMSESPLILVVGLQRYLDNFPYGCTEQLTSKAFPLLAMSGQPWFATDLSVVNDKISTTIQMLGQRQMSNGGFSYWPGYGENDGNRFASIYAMHFLTEARAQGHNVPTELFNAGITYLKDLAAQNASNIDMAREQAYAIYILTRNEIVTTNYLTNLQLYLDKEQSLSWKQSLISSYIASTYQLLKNQSVADQLIVGFKPQAPSTSNDFYDSNIANAQYLYLVARHFPERLTQIGDKITPQLVAAINSGELNTILSSYTSLALSAYVQPDQKTTNTRLSISEQSPNHQKKIIATIESTYGKANVDEKAQQILFNNPNKLNYFYQLTQTGFNENLPTKPLHKGLEIYREYRDNLGKVIDNTRLGTEIEVHIQGRSLSNRYISNTAIVDLLPGGFEVVRDSVNAASFNYIDIREDRVIFFGGLDTAASEIVYRIKAINAGKYTVPPIFAESMYDPNIRAYSAAESMSVTK